MDGQDSPPYMVLRLRRQIPYGGGDALRPGQRDRTRVARVFARSGVDVRFCSKCKPSGS